MIGMFTAMLFIPLSAQKGMGATEGISRSSGAGLESLAVTGVLMEVHVHPCDQTTGKAPEGMHLHLKDGEDGLWNVHLGPADPVQRIIGRLKPGTEISVSGFRSERLPEGHVIARMLVVGEKRWQLRDEDLRPVWRKKLSKVR